MKILLLCWRDTGHPQGGGSERYLERVGRYLSQCGHDVVLRTAAYSGAAHRESQEGVEFQRYGGRYTVYVRAALAMVAGRLGAGPLRGVDAVIDTQNGIPFFARTFLGRPTILLTHHCHRRQWPVAGPIIGRLGWWLEAWLAPRLNRSVEYVTVSGPSRDELVGLGVPRERIHIIRNGVDPVPEEAREADSEEEPLCLEDEPLRLVTLSRLVPHKRIEHALEVVARSPNVVLDVIGSGWWEPKLRGYARDLGIEHRVVFHGQVSDLVKHRILARAAVHLMPSKAEGWGLAVIEAAQHYVPTIGYAVAGGLHDSIVDGITGVLVGEDDLEQYIAAVRAVLDDAALRRELGVHAGARAGRFSWEDTGRSFEELVEQITAGFGENKLGRTGWAGVGRAGRV